MGKKWGKGTLMANSCRYTGNWYDESPVGPVEITFSSGRYYKG